MQERFEMFRGDAGNRFLAPDDTFRDEVNSDAHRGLYLDGQVSTSQLFSAVGVVLATTMLLVGWQRRREARA